MASTSLVFQRRAASSSGIRRRVPKASKLGFKCPLGVLCSWQSKAAAVAEKLLRSSSPPSLDGNRRATEWRGGGGAVQGSGAEGRCALFRSASSGDRFRRWLLPSLLATDGAWMIMVGSGGGDVSLLIGEDAVWAEF
nr:hypothetical protein Itr_chr01CG03790 [Ipomoea trifida]